MKFLVIGPCASGKDTVAAILRQKGYKQLVSYTDRPRRPGEADTHVFTTTDKLPTQNVIAKTKIGDYTYLATREQFDDADVYVIDPRGIADLDDKVPHESVDLIYVNANPDLREARWIQRDPSPDAKQKFVKRVFSEAPQFLSFELALMQSVPPFSCIRKIYIYENEGDEDALARAVDEILQDSTAPKQ